MNRGECGRGDGSRGGGGEREGKETDGCPLTLPTPPSKVRRHDAQRPPGGHQICSSEGD
jgi:hypothetical protein